MPASSRFQRPRISFDDDDGNSQAVRSLPQLVDYNNTHNPGAVFAHQAIKQTGDGQKRCYEIVTVTHGQLAEAVRRCRLFLLERAPLDWTAEVIEPSQEWPAKPRPISLFMESDVHYFAMLIACLSLGIPLLVVSPKLSPEAIASLVEQCQVQLLLTSVATTSRAEAAVGKLAKPLSLKVRLVSPDDFHHISPPQMTLLDAGQDTPPAPSTHYNSSTDRNVIIFHSSGTTGLPKPVYHAHAYILKYGTCGDFSETECAGLNMTTLPLYHGYGMIGPLLSMTNGKAVAWLPPSIVPTAHSILLLLKSLFIDTLMTVPGLLQELADLDQGRGLDALGQLKMVASGGGPIGDRLMEALRSAHVPLLNAFGITEIGGLNVMFVPKSGYDCRYFRFRADMGLELRQLNEGESAHELSATPPGWTERFVARDVLERRPGSSELDFRSVARNDGLVILSTGLKFVPNALEQRVISSDDSISAALIFGNERPEIGWLIEPKTTVLTHEAPYFRARVWSVIEEAQSNEPDYSMVWTPDLVIVITGERRLPRSDKGSVMRTAAYTAFENDVNRAYESLAFDSAALPTDPLDKGNITNGIRDCVSHFISLPETATNDSDLFELGLNSILALQLSRYIAARRPDRSIQLRAAFVYESPTINQMAAILAGSTRTPCHGIMPENHASQMVAKYSTLSGEADETSYTVLLTGATGSLGSHILADLIADNSVARVICLVRKSALSFQERLRTKGAALQPRDMAKVIVIECHFTSTNFGLTSAQYEKIARQVTHVLHCAWPMDFRLTANSFESQYAILQDLLRLMEESSSVKSCATSRFLFVSSIAVVNQCARFYDGQPAPEKLIDWSDITFELGYGQAKAICEMILANVARASRPYSIGVVRLGQVSGSSQTGYWNTAEHLPTLFKMSKLANAFPRLTETFSWLPVDRAARILSELLNAAPAGPFSIYHVQNPHRQAWSDVLPVILDELALPEDALVSYEDWQALVFGKSHAFQSSPALQLAAENLHSFFQAQFNPSASPAGVVLGMEKAIKLSNELRQQSQPVSETTLRSYFQRFRACGFL